MSLKSNAFSCNELKDKLSSKKQLNNLWKQFMCSYGYQKYYNYSKDSNNNSTITPSLHPLVVKPAAYVWPPPPK